MNCCALFLNSTLFPITINIKSVTFKNQSFFLRQSSIASANLSTVTKHKSLYSVHSNSLRVLEWDKLCDSVSSFATTSFGREATKVKSAIQQARRSLPVDGNAAMAVAALLQHCETLQLNLKAAIKEDADWYRRFMPLTEEIIGFVINRSLVKLILQIIDEDGSVKDSASPTLKRSREQVRMLERKIYQLMDSLIRSEKNETPFLEVSNIDGRWCIKSGADQLKGVKGLLLYRQRKHCRATLCCSFK